MSTKIFLLSFVLLAILVANMPTVKAIACDGVSIITDCTDCTLAANAASPDCYVWDTTTSSYSFETTTKKQHHGHHKGGRRGRRGSRPIFNFFF